MERQPGTKHLERIYVPAGLVGFVKDAAPSFHLPETQAMSNLFENNAHTGESLTRTSQARPCSTTSLACRP